MNQTNDFLNKISASGELNIEINTLNRIYSSLEEVDIMNENVYFLGGIADGLHKRANDDDIVGVNYIRFDIDLIKNLKEEDIIVKSEELGDYIDLLKSKLDELDFFKEYSYIIISGGGCHIYYIGDVLEITEHFGSKEFSYAMQRIYRKYDEVIGEKFFRCDMACKNIARIMRLPGTINQKYNFECSIVYEQDVKSRFIKLLPSFAYAEKTEIESKRTVEQEKRLQEAIENRKLNKIIYGKDESEKMEMIFDQINKTPAYLVSEILLPEFKLHTNNKNFISGRKGKGNAFKGFYYVEETNTICNGGSSEYAYGDCNSCFSPSVLVRNFYGYTWAETMQWFKKNFKLNF